MTFIYKSLHCLLPMTCKLTNILSNPCNYLFIIINI